METTHHDSFSFQHYSKVMEARGAPLVKKLLQTEGITGVFLGKDFISVNKDEEESWEVRLVAPWIHVTFLLPSARRFYDPSCSTSLWMRW